jgi:hypothetical protein
MRKSILAGVAAAVVAAAPAAQADMAEIIEKSLGALAADLKRDGYALQSGALFLNLEANSVSIAFDGDGVVDATLPGPTTDADTASLLTGSVTLRDAPPTLLAADYGAPVQSALPPNQRCGPNSPRAWQGPWLKRFCNFPTRIEQVDFYLNGTSYVFSTYLQPL